eukprot:3283382-Amphidinium_carterae.1
MNEGVSADLPKRLQIGDRYFVKCKCESVVHERPDLWPIDQRGGSLRCPRRTSVMSSRDHSGHFIFVSELAVQKNYRVFFIYCLRPLGQATKTLGD